jgi:hypothetical protein
MYLVVSKWEVLPGKETEFESASKKMRELIRSWPGVRLVEGLRNENGAIAVVGYDDEDTHRRLVLDPGGPFEKHAAELSLDSLARWVWSERGNAV